MEPDDLEDIVYRAVRRALADGPYPELLLTVPQAAERLSIGTTKLYDLINGGQLRAVRLGSVLRVPVEALAAYVDQLDDHEEWYRH